LKQLRSDIEKKHAFVGGQSAAAKAMFTAAAAFAAAAVDGGEGGSPGLQ
jgi:hypothetical protein